MSNDIAYNNRDFIPGADSYPPRWAAAAAAFRDRLSDDGRAHLGLPYGPAARQALDLFLPSGAAVGTVMFVHGGYWRMFDRSSWSHLAAGALARGWAVAMPSYRLCPEVGIPDITADITACLRHLADTRDGPIRLTGHSAGGHLVARMLCRDVDIGAAEGRLAGCCAISPVVDLRPLIDTAMNADLRLDDATTLAESPCLAKDVRPVPTMVWVGAQERPAFLDQARCLAGAWPNARLHVAPGQHHFSIVEPLAAPDSPLTDALLD
ncbi:MAG: alpha/beta hydrolase [Rhodobacterales bacterium]|nr:alpha/beta hydrolase [Rhodobacterales bacterium]